MKRLIYTSFSSYLCVYVCICICVYVCVYTYIYMYVCVYAYVWSRVYLHYFLEVLLAYSCLQCCVSVYRTAPWLSCMYRYIPRFWISSAHISLQSAEESFLCCTVFSHYYLLLYCVFFIHSATGECFSYFQVLAVVNSAAMNTGVCVSFRISFLQIYKLYRESFLHSWEWDCWIIWQHKFYYTM